MNRLSLISMPTYEFRCPDGHEFEKFYRTISGAASEAVCPVCGKVAERFMSAAGFAFKGSGFYLTDYGKNAHRDKGTPEPKSGEPSSKESSGDSSSKPDSSGALETRRAQPPARTARRAPSRLATRRSPTRAPKKRRTPSPPSLNRPRRRRRQAAASERRGRRAAAGDLARRGFDWCARRHRARPRAPARSCLR